MRNFILGVDPGQQTGIAIFAGGKLIELKTISPCDLASLAMPQGIARVIFEDSRLQSHIWAAASVNRAAALKIARNVGQVDAWSGLIVAICEQLCIPCNGISPKNKGKKLDANQFFEVTGWAGRSNQHERDAAMVAWPYRRAALHPVQVLEGAV